MKKKITFAVSEISVEWRARLGKSSCIHVAKKTARWPSSQSTIAGCVSDSSPLYYC